MAAATSCDVFRFFDLPPEIRNWVYGFLTEDHRRQALIQTSPHHGSGHSAHLSFRDTWMPQLLLVTKQFSAEYFHEVCTHQLTCTVLLGAVSYEGPANGLPLNPAAAMKALSKTPRLIGRAVVSAQIDLDVFNTSLDEILPSLLPAMPGLKVYDESLYVWAHPISHTMRNGNSIHLDAIHNELLGGDDNARVNKFRTLLTDFWSKHTDTETDTDTDSDIVTYKREAFVGDYLCSELETREGKDDTWVMFRAMPRVGGEVNEAYLWHGLELKQFMITDGDETRPC